MRRHIAIAIISSLAAFSVFAGGRGEPDAVSTDLSIDFNTRYQEYSPERFDAAAEEFHRIYFFHASWCPTCRRAHGEFLENLDRIPEDVVIFKLDYDTETQLRREFAITYQHTFVLVDESNQIIQKWTGGNLSTLITAVRDHT